MEKRVLIAIAISVAILFVFQYFEKGQRVPPAPAKPPVAQEAPPALQKPKAVTAPVPSGTETAAAPRKVVVQGDLYRAVLDNRGGVLSSWILEHYESAHGKPFEMIPARMAGEEAPLPMSLYFDEAGLTEVANKSYYEVEIAGAAAQKVLRPPVTVVMRLRHGDLTIEKRFHFEKNNYLVDFSGSFEQAGKSLPAQVYIGQDIGPQQEHLLNPSVKLQAISNMAGKVERYSPPEKPDEVRVITGETRWVGLDMQYFSVLAIPSHPLPEFSIQNIPVQITGTNGKETTRNLIRVTIPADGSISYRDYIGPKSQTYLDAVPGVNFNGVIDYGIFSILVWPLLYSLKFIYQYVHNYGYAIIILTFILTLLLFPFRLKQMLSMKKMAVVQPKVKAIQEKYKKYKKTDPKRAEMNQEIMALYRENNVNPLGGCLPLILQMPLLFAFYRLLASSIELRQAPFVGWIGDLAAKDPYYVLPIVMGITMLISQKMTPMTPGGDPTQAKMMMVMPVIFTVMFLNVSAGLNLYFLCSNVFQISFQKIAERWVGDDKKKHRDARK